MWQFTICSIEDRVSMMLKFDIICNDKTEKKGKWSENDILKKFKGKAHEWFHIVRSGHWILILCRFNIHLCPLVTYHQCQIRCCRLMSCHFCLIFKWLNIFDFYQNWFWIGDLDIDSRWFTWVLFLKRLTKHSLKTFDIRNLRYFKTFIC